jgi:hypothetical protein
MSNRDHNRLCNAHKNVQHKRENNKVAEGVVRHTNFASVIGKVSENFFRGEVSQEIPAHPSGKGNLKEK